VARYPLNQPIRLSTTVRDVTGTLINATTLTLLVKIAQADGTQLTTGTYASPANDSTGTYHQDVPVTDLAAAGHYQYTWTATGTGAGVSFGDFDVFDPFEAAVLPLGDAKDALNIPQATTAYDSELQSYIATIQSNLERVTGGPLVNRVITAERAELLSNQTVILVRQRPLVQVNSIMGAGGVNIDISAGLKYDVNAGTVRKALGLPFYGPFFQWLPECYVTYVAGWGTSVPSAFNIFARIVLQHLWETQRGPLAMPMAGEQAVMVPGFGFAIPARAAELLNGSQNGVPFLTEAYV